MTIAYVPVDGTSLAVTQSNSRVDATAGAVTYQLPPLASAAGDTYTFEKTDSSGNTVTIKASGSDTIIGQATIVLTLQYQTIRIYAPLSGTDWLLTSTTISSDASTHAALTAAHGATGAVVGTTNVQSFTAGAKTFASGILNATRPKITTSIDDSAGNPLVSVTATASAVNAVTLANAATGTNPTLTASGSDTDIGLTIAAKGAGVVSISGATVQGKITTISGDGAITIAPSNVALTKGSAAAITIAAPSSGQAGTIVKIVSGSAFAHVITFTGATLDDGITGGGKTTVTMAAFVGSSIEVLAYNLRWTVISKNAITSVV